jgi:predicted dehydrogenase
MEKVGIGLIGAGLMGYGVSKSLLELNDRLHVCAVFDPDQRSIDKVLKGYDSPPRIYNDYRDLVRADDVDWVMISSWNCFHREHTIAAFEAGKHVFCQKPLAITLEDCRAMYESWQKSGKMFNIGFTLRYSPHYRKIKELIDGGAVGKIVSLEFNEAVAFNHGGFIMGNWRRLRKYAGTHLLEKCCHDIDLVNWMVGSRSKRVASFGGLDFYKPENEYHMTRLRRDKFGKQAYMGTVGAGLVNLNPFTSDKDIVDNQVGIIEYENGARATFHTNCNAAIRERRMYILGTEGAIRGDVLTGKIETAKIGYGEKITDVSTEAKGGHGDGDPVLAAELADSMANGTPPAVGLREGVESAVTCFAMDDAMDTGKVVDVGPYWEKAGW